MESVEQNLTKCRQCGALKLRILDGKYDSDNKRWIDETGRQWSGRICASCHSDNTKNRATFKRQVTSGSA